MGKRSTALKLFFAEVLDKLFPRKYCWADLVQWAYGYVEWEDVGRKIPCNACKECGPYCEKCVELGLLEYPVVQP